MSKLQTLDAPSVTAVRPIDRSQPFLPLLVVLFIGSGCAALIYEIVWFQLLQLVIGSTGISMGVLLGTFMGGMCLGSLILPRLISSRLHPLRVYAILELCIGAIGIGVLWGMPWIADKYTHMAEHGILARAMVGTLCLLPPTLLMGATLPAISRWVEATPQGVSWMGFFYGGNIAGAVAGCVLAGFFLLPTYNMPTATYVAVGINALVGILGLVLAAFTVHQPPPKSRPVTPLDAPQVSDKHIYLVTALSGLTGLGAEVVWTRLLGLMLGQTVYTFSIILAVFLFGLGIGSTIGSLIARQSSKPRLALAVCQFALAAAIGWTAFSISSSLPFWPIEPEISTKPSFMFQLDIARAMWAILPAAILWGASFPLALANVCSRGQDPGRLVGGVYAANTLGAIAGALGFALFLVPGVGTKICEQILIALTVISGGIVLLPMILEPAEAPETEDGAADNGARMAGLCTFGVVALTLSVFLIMSVKPMNWGAVAFGRNSASWMPHLEPGIIRHEDIPKASPDHDWYCIYVGEGMNVTAAVTESKEGYRYFHGAGKVQASTDPRDMRLQRMLGHISALTFKNHSPEKVLVVACGAGVTAGSFIPYDSVKRIVICDIEPLVPTKVTPMFSSVNYGIVDGIEKENPHMVDGKQVQVMFDDGRHYIRTTDEKFDVITSDPIDPWVKGCAALNTVEYYQMCRDHLNPGGVMALWIPLYESNLDTFKSVLGTFFKVFPNGILWSNDNGAGGYDAVLYAQVETTRIDLDETEQWIEAHPKVRRSLLDVGFGAGKDSGEGFGFAADLYASYAGQAKQLVEWSRDAQLNYDSNLRLQYLAGMWLNSKLSDQILNDVLRYYRFPGNIFSGSPKELESLNAALIKANRHDLHRIATVTPAANSGNSP